MIEVKNLTRKYGSFVAVNSISFEIKKGQIVGLLGHNGAGKTTTLRMLTGYLEPSGGQITIAGLDVQENLQAVQTKIGYLSENSALYPEMTIWQYLEYVAELRGIPENERDAAVAKAIRATELQSKAAEYISTLSKGYKQRVGVAQAIIHEPEILVLDEPTNGLDPTQIQHMRDLIKELAKHSTVILSTHIMQEVEAICDRVIIILNGRIAIDSDLALLQKNNVLSLTLKQEPKTVEAALKSVVGVHSVTTLREEKGFYHYQLEVSEPQSVTPNVARKIFENGWDLYQIHGENKNLESIFKEVNAGTPTITSATSN